MEKPLPFLIERQGNLELNEEVLKIISKSINPRLLLFYGQTRQGKSTTLNQLIRGNIDTWKYMNKSPFKSQTSQQSLTEGCDIFGPIKSSEINRRHQTNRKIKVFVKTLIINDIMQFFPGSRIFGVSVSWEMSSF